MHDLRVGEPKLPGSTGSVGVSNRASEPEAGTLPYPLIVGHFLDYNIGHSQIAVEVF
jgi:hypothetical protein